MRQTRPFRFRIVVLVEGGGEDVVARAQTEDTARAMLAIVLSAIAAGGTGYRAAFLEQGA